MDLNAKISSAGHRGLVGSAILRRDPFCVIPAEAGIQAVSKALDARLRGHDEKGEYGRASARPESHFSGGIKDKTSTKQAFTCTVLIE